MLSVILPTRNANRDELNRAIESCLSLNVKVCICFDHADDEPYSTDYLQFDGVKHVVKRVGKVQAMNEALALVDTPYYLYLGDDDWLGAGIVELANVLNDNPQYAFTYGRQQYHGAVTHAVVATQYTSDSIFRSNVPLNAIVHRTELVKSLGGYDDGIHNIDGAGKPEDYDLLLTLIEAGYNGIAVNTQDVVIHYTLSHSREWAKMQQHNKAVTEAFKRKHPSFTGHRL